ncbi:MAG: DNA repair protein RecN [Clostridia bacterium]|nr:DNA repair protein RecN [Clostridia bacterium]
MLLQLQIENVAIIEKLNMTLSEGFNVLTGETGAGKSILIDSLNALLGSRVSRELIRSGADKATVQGLFSHGPELNQVLSEFGLEAGEDETILISRTFNEAGKNICRVNGSLVTVAMLKEIGQRLVDIHGQHDNQSLLRPETHITLLDLFAGGKLTELKKAYQTELQELHSLRARLKGLSGEGKERERTMDMLRFQIEEIERAGLTPGEDEELERQSRVLSHAEEIIESFANAYEWVKGGDSEEQSALDKLGDALEAIQKVEDIDPDYAGICATLEEVQEKLSDLSRHIRQVRDSMEYDPRLHKSVEERISLIQGLKKKYGEGIPEILSFLGQAKARLDEMERSEELILELKARIDRAEKSLHKQCDQMNALRKEAAKLLQKGILKELADLEMPKTQFEASVISCPEEGFTEDGTDRVEFQFSPNPGEPLKPLSKIASGGEMSRVMLAVKSILAGIDAIPTLVFDEIDTGVSGKAASKVGEKLKAVARGHQVLCITHHAQIASLADAHYFIRKAEQAGRTVTSVQVLEEQQREDEITRLLSGEQATEAARSLARELLKNGRA